MREQLRTVVVVAATLGILVVAAVQSWQAQVPELSYAPVPLVASQLRNEPGRVRLEVSVGVDGVAKGRVLEMDHAGLAAYALKMLADWHFYPGSATRFEFMFRSKMTTPAEPCKPQQSDSTEPTTLVARPPTEIEITSPQMVICESSPFRFPATFRVGVLAGRVICDCPGREGITGLQLVINGLGANRQVSRLVNTDASGIFRADGLPPGEYLIQAGNRRFRPTEYVALLDPSLQDSALIDLPIHPAPESPTVMSAFVSSIVLPDFPRELRKAGVQGAVRLRLSMNGDGFGDINVETAVPNLAKSTIANVRGWKFTGTTTPVVVVNYRYRLIEGDCTADQRPTITMRLPSEGDKEVEVVAKRIIPCSPIPKSLLPSR